MPKFFFLLFLCDFVWHAYKLQFITWNTGNFLCWFFIQMKFFEVNLVLNEFAENSLLLEKLVRQNRSFLPECVPVLNKNDSWAIPSDLFLIQKWQKLNFYWFSFFWLELRAKVQIVIKICFDLQQKPKILKKFA